MNLNHNKCSKYIFEMLIDFLLLAGGYGVVFKVRNFSHKYFALKRLCVNSEEDLVRSKQEMTLLVRCVLLLLQVMQLPH